MKKKIICLFILVLLISSYALAQPPGKSKTKIIKGQTTQNELLKSFGSPNIATMDKSGNEVWAYYKVAVKNGTSTLTIIFDDKDVVKDFSYKPTPSSEK